MEINHDSIMQGVRLGKRQRSGSSNDRDGGDDDNKVVNPANVLQMFERLIASCNGAAAPWPHMDAEIECMHRNTYYYVLLHGGRAIVERHAGAQQYYCHAPRVDVQVHGNLDTLTDLVMHIAPITCTLPALEVHVHSTARRTRGRHPKSR